MNLPIGSNLAVDIYIPKQPIPNLTEHAFANQSNFIAPGNVVAAQTLTNAVETDSMAIPKRSRGPGLPRKRGDSNIGR